MKPALQADGFTLLECLAAATIGLLFASLVCVVLNQAFSCWRGSRNLAEIHREAGVALFIIERDLRGATDLPEVESFEIHAPTHARQIGDTLSFVSRSGVWVGAGKPGDLSVAGYFLRWREGNPYLSGGFDLCRFFREPPDVFANLNVGRLLEMESRDNVEVLARNVSRFDVSAWRKESDGKWAAFEWSVDNPLPDVVEIQLGVLSSEKAARLHSPADWLANGKAQTDGHTFNLQVHLPSARARQ